MKFTKNDEAVSPVIGVILMVAITVILAAVIAAFVFGMAGNLTKSKVVAVTVQKVDSSHINVMNQGGQDQPGLVAINATTPGVTAGCATGTGVTSIPPYCQLKPAEVGSVVTLTGTYSGRTQVVVIGNFNDGTNQVLLDTYV